MAFWPDPPGNVQHLVARAGRNVEQSHARNHVRRIDQRHCCRHQSRLDGLALADLSHACRTATLNCSGLKGGMKTSGKSISGLPA